MKQAVDSRSARDVLSAITRDLALLLSQLFGIASAEGRVAAGAARNGAVVATAGACLLVCGAVTLMSALVLVMVALGLPPWAAALAVGVLLTFGGAVGLHIGVEMVRRVRLEFPETRDAITEGVSWLKNLQR